MTDEPVLPAAGAPTLGFLCGALACGIALSWCSSYVLVPTEPKWHDARSIPFLASLVYTAVASAIGACLFAIGLLVVGIASQRSQPRYSAGLLCGAAFSLAVVGGPDALERWLMATTPEALLTTVVQISSLGSLVLVPVLLAMFASPRIRST